MTTTSTESESRADFEKYAAQLGCTDFEETSEDGIRRYTNPFIEAKWNYWTASRDALSARASGSAAPTAWEYENQHGDRFLTHIDPSSWHAHDREGFKNFRPMVYAALTRPAADGAAQTPVGSSDRDAGEIPAAAVDGEEAAWTVTAPDGRSWSGPSAFRAASKASQATRTPEQAATLLATLRDEQAKADAEMVADHEHLNCPACGGSGHVDDVTVVGRNAERYEWLRRLTAAGRTESQRQQFVLPYVSPAGLDLFRGSVAQHLDAAIDAAMKAWVA